MLKKRILVLSIFLAFTLNSFTQQIEVLTFNIRYNNPADSENCWDNRKEAVVQLLNHYHPEIVGIQEGLYEQVTYLHDHLKNYDYIGAGREDGKIKGEFAAIFYDTTMFELVKQSTFWLSETPDSVSVGWDAALERICTYGLFRHKNNGRYIMVFNTHFDHLGVVARTESARLLVRAAAELTRDQISVVLMGDFNCGPESEAFQIIKSKYPEASGISQTPLYGPAGTFNNFVPSNDVKERIDFVFVSKLRVLSVTHIDDKRNNNRVISDHYPVMVEIDF